MAQKISNLKNLFKVKIKTPKQNMRLTKKLLKCRNNMNKHKIITLKIIASVNFANTNKTWPP